MIRKERKLAQLLGVYIDDEADFVKAYEEQLNIGVVFKINCSKLSLNNNYFKQIQQNFFIFTSKHNLRGHCSKPYLSTDEVYSLGFSLTASGEIEYEYELDFKNPTGFYISSENIDFLKKALINKHMFMQVKRIKKGELIKKIFQKEYLDDSYAYGQNLKDKILRQLNMCKNQRLVAHRLSLWGYSQVKIEEIAGILPKLTPSDFGIKDLVELRRIWMEFNLNLTNDQLLYDKDPEISSYLAKLNKNIIKLSSHQSLDFSLHTTI